MFLSLRLIYIAFLYCFFIIIYFLYRKLKNDKKQYKLKNILSKFLQDEYCLLIKKWMIYF